MSPRAAWRLESLGFSRVFDYVAGKADWFAAGLPIEGRLAGVPKAGDIARADVPTCRPTDRIADVRARMLESKHKTYVVTNEEGIVLGRLRPRAIESNPEALAGDVMEPGPTTIRPDGALDAVVDRLRNVGVGSIIVTDPDGRLIGVLYRKDAEEALAKAEPS